MAKPYWCQPGQPTNFSSSCFLKGTAIHTTIGERKIEDLKRGDHIYTSDASEPIEEILSFEFIKPWPHRAIPVRIARSAIAHDVPNADLYLSPGHAILIDGMLVTAECLLNGRTISYADDLELDPLQYFHVKLSSHKVLFAAGVASESYVESLAEFTMPRLHATTTRNKIASQLRSAVSPWIDTRQPNDIIRDRLKQRAVSFDITNRRIPFQGISV